MFSADGNDLTKSSCPQGVYRKNDVEPGVRIGNMGCWEKSRVLWEHVAGSPCERQGIRDTLSEEVVLKLTPEG